MSHKTSEQHKAFAKEMANGANLRQAMMKAGWSEKQANKGQKALSKKMLSALAAEGYKMAEFGKKFSMEELGNITLGRLAMNALNGKDGGVMSAKTLGSHRALNFWAPDNIAGVIVLAAPQAAMDRKAELLGEISESESKPGTLPE